MKQRIDKWLVENSKIESRIKAQKLIENGLILCNGKVVGKPSFAVDETDKVEISDNQMFKYVSRGGFKLEKALDSFNYSLDGKTVMDIGSSTGGFTDCALKNGAKKVIAIDVGTDLMDLKLRADQRVELHEKTDIRALDNKMFEVDVVVTDVSFISLKKIVDKLADTKCKLDFIALIKPQFECGKDIAKKFKGVILNKKIHIEILKDVLDYLMQKGFDIKGLDTSSIRGGDGNIEYLCYSSNIKTSNSILNFDIEKLVENAFKNSK